MMEKRGRKFSASAFSWLDIPRSVTEYSHFPFQENAGESMEEHPRPQILKDLLLGRLSSGDRKQVIAHLITGCSSCREEMAPTAAVLFRPHRNPTDTIPVDEDLYDRAIDAAYKKTLARQRSLEREREEADAKIEQLLNDPIAGKSASFWTWGLYERLQERSWALRQNDPAGMLRLARFAVEAAERLSERKYPAKDGADLLARAWLDLANAYRISDQIFYARTALEQSLLAFHRGTRSPLLRARIAEISASLLCDQREFPSAFRALDFAYSLYLKRKALHEAGRVLIIKGLHTGYTGDPEEGITLLSRGLRLIDRKRDPKLAFQALHNILLFRVDLEEFKTARRQIWNMRPLYEFQSDRLAKVKLRGIEGRVFAGLGELDRAARAFQQAKESFLQEGLDYDAALISLDLAAVWLREHKSTEVRQLLQEMLDIFRVRYIAREGIAALILLRKAADRNELTIDHLERASRLFESLKEEPKPVEGSAL